MCKAKLVLLIIVAATAFAGRLLPVLKTFMRDAASKDWPPIF